MKKFILLLALQACISLTATAQVITIPVTKQEQTQWCWAASSKALLDYYKLPQSQCDIAEWVRKTATFHSFGQVNCCEDPSKGCNYWNYNFGYAGSIQEILIHFGSIQNQGDGSPLTLDEVTSDMQKNRLFVIRLQWKDTSGHFVVGHGINGDNIYYMDPDSQEGYFIIKYNTLTDPSRNGFWQGTNRITSNAGVDEAVNKGAISFHPNPFYSATTLQCGTLLKNACLTVYDSQGQQVRQIQNISGQTIDFDRRDLRAGIYFIRLTQGNACYSGRVVIRDN